MNLLHIGEYVKRTGLDKDKKDPLQITLFTFLHDCNPCQKMVRPIAPTCVFCYFTTKSLGPTLQGTQLVTSSLKHMETHACTATVQGRTWICLWNWFRISVSKCLEEINHLLCGTQKIPGSRRLAANSTWEISVCWYVHHNWRVKLHCHPINILAVLEAIRPSIGWAIAFWWQWRTRFSAHNCHLITFG